MNDNKEIAELKEKINSVERKIDILNKKLEETIQNTRSKSYSWIIIPILAITVWGITSILYALK